MSVSGGRHILGVLQCCINMSRPAMQLVQTPVNHHYSQPSIQTRSISKKFRPRPKPKIVLPRPPLSEKSLKHYFVDSIPVRIKGGDGGNGCIGFTSLPFKEWAGPDGGDGGNGGHVIARANSQTKSLAHVKTVMQGNKGVDGRTKCRHGKCADHTIISVPLGTLVRDADSMELLAELYVEDQQHVLARGGAGGRGNHFYLSNEVRAPTVAEIGGIGEERQLLLEMKVAAHVGLIGFPNAGKSTLLTALSRANPKIADYPFTTLKPHIGMVQYDDGLQIAVADIPGLIDGSHMDKGLGIAFLRHIEKCTCLLYVIDMSNSNPLKTLEQLKFELEKYQQYLSRRPHAILANKVDLADAADRVSDLQAQVNLPVIPVSGKCRINVDILKNEIRTLYDKYSSHQMTT